MFYLKKLQGFFYACKLCMLYQHETYRTTGFLGDKSSMKNKLNKNCSASFMPVNSVF